MCNFKGGFMEVISLDDNRVKVNLNDVTKKTEIKEVNNLIKAYELINDDVIYINGEKFKIKIPKVLSFDNRKLTMEKCKGSNLELILRTPRSHLLGVEFTNNIILQLLHKNFFWKDFAPRNILIDTNTISIFDFERGLNTQVESVRLYLAENVYEEYSAFLLPNERILKADDIFNMNVNGDIIKINTIKSRRIRTILSKLGYINEAPIHIYLLAVKMIIMNEEPSKVNDEYIFPLLMLEEYIKNYGYEKYAEKIIGGYNAKTKKI